LPLCYYTLYCRYTEEAIQFVEKYAKDLGYQTTLTNKGALLITVPGKNDEVQRCITVLFDNLSLLHIFRQIELLLLCLLKDY
jgi:putative aminopeptidase FrvX